MADGSDLVMVQYGVQCVRPESLVSMSDAKTGSVQSRARSVVDIAKRAVGAFIVMTMLAVAGLLAYEDPADFATGFAIGYVSGRLR